jgi:hypothetical protein
MRPKPLQDIEKRVRAPQPTHARSWSPSSRKCALHSSTREERKCTAELKDRLAFLELEVESSSACGGDTNVRLEEHVCTLEQELLVRRTTCERKPRWRLECGERSVYALSIGTHWVQVADGIENEQVQLEHKREELSARAKDQVADAADSLRTLVHRFDSPLFSRESGRAVLVDALREADPERRGV